MSLDFFGGGDDGSDSAKEAIRKNRAIYDAIKDPAYADYNPELYKTETANYELTNDNPLLKSAQMSALAKMAGLADSGLSEVDQAGYEKARSIAGQVQNQGQAAALQNAQARGVGGSGLEFAMKEMGNQAASTRAQDAGLQQAADSARQRAMYQQAYGQQLAGARDQDYRTASQNTGIINQFNNANTQNRNATNQANTDQRNGAFKYNEGTKDKVYNNQLSRAGINTGFNNQQAQIEMASAAARTAQQNAMTDMAIKAGAAYMTGGASLAAEGAQKKQ